MEENKAVSVDESGGRPKDTTNWDQIADQAEKRTKLADRPAWTLPPKGPAPASTKVPTPAQLRERESQLAKAREQVTRAPTAGKRGPLAQVQFPVAAEEVQEIPVPMPVLHAQQIEVFQSGMLMGVLAGVSVALLGYYCYVKLYGSAPEPAVVTEAIKKVAKKAAKGKAHVAVEL